MHEPESALENETNNILGDFEIQTGRLILARRPDLRIMFLKSNLPFSGFFCPICDHKGKIKENEKRQILWHFKRSKKSVEHEVDSDSNCNWRAWNCLKWLEKVEIGEWIETLEAKALLRSAWILRRSLVTWGDLQSHRLHWKIISWRWSKKYASRKINIRIRLGFFYLFYCYAWWNGRLWWIWQDNKNQTLTKGLVVMFHSLFKDLCKCLIYIPFHLFSPSLCFQLTFYQFRSYNIFEVHGQSRLAIY